MNIWVSILLVLLMLGMYQNYRVITGRKEYKPLSMGQRKTIFITQVAFIVTGLWTLLTN